MSFDVRRCQYYSNVKNERFRNFESRIKKKKKKLNTFSTVSESPDLPEGGACGERFRRLHVELMKITTSDQNVHRAAVGRRVRLWVRKSRVPTRIRTRTRRVYTRRQKRRTEGVSINKFRTFGRPMETYPGRSPPVRAKVRAQRSRTVYTRNTRADVQNRKYKQIIRHNTYANACEVCA